jgi:hypothetical protein
MCYYWIRCGLSANSLRFASTLLSQEAVCITTFVYHYILAQGSSLHSRRDASSCIIHSPPQGVLSFDLRDCAKKKEADVMIGWIHSGGSNPLYLQSLSA